MIRELVSSSELLLKKVQIFKNAIDMLKILLPQ
jgi:hypothetical protein